MSTKIQPYQRHFAYKHPTFGTKHNPKPEAAWKGSIYFWWWSYLKKNEDYIQCCNKNGKGKLSKLYVDFGDVRGDDFKAWWSENSRGADLFAEPRAEDSVRILKSGDKAIDSSDTLTLSFPLYFPKRYLERQFKAVLALHHNGKRGRQVAKLSKAKYKVKGQPNISAIKQALEVYDYWLANPDKKLWEIGNELPRLQVLNKLNNDTGKGINTNKKNILAATVSRYLKKAKTSIANTSNGVFP